MARTVSTSGLNPGSTACKLRSVSTMTPALSTRIVVKATWAAISRLCSRWLADGAEPRKRFCSPAAPDLVEARRAGMRLRARPEPATMIAMAPTTRPSKAISSARGSPSGTSARMASNEAITATSANVPPIADTTRLSTTTCSAMRPRPAPSAARKANSGWRMSPRASSRLATLRLASNRIAVEAATSSNEGRRAASTVASCNGSYQAARRSRSRRNPPWPWSSSMPR